MLRKLIVLAGLLGAGVAGVVLFSKFSGEAAAEARAPTQGTRLVPVRVEAARTVDLPVVLSGLGSVVPSQSVTVRSRVAGQLVRVAFREGDLVERGQLLAEIDPRPFQTRVVQADGQLARDRALLGNARVELDRARLLAAELLVSAQEVAAKESLVEQYQGAERISQGVLSAAELELGFTRVTAPIRGRVGFRHLDLGNNVGISDALVVIHAVQPIAVFFTLPEDDVPVVVRELRKAEQNGKKLEVEAWDKGSRTLLGRGVLRAIDNQIDPATGTVRLKAEFDNETGTLFPSQFVNVRFVVDVVQGATVVPVAAVQRGRDGPFAYVVGDDQAVSVRQLELGVSDGGESVVRDGLSVGELVVTQGADQVREGTRVKPSSEGQRSATPKEGQPSAAPKEAPARPALASP